MQINRCANVGWTGDKSYECFKKACLALQRSEFVKALAVHKLCAFLSQKYKITP
jgi:hypothetical protein